MPAFETLTEHQAHLVRKMRTGSVFTAPLTSTIPTRLTAAGDDLPTALPAGYVDLGLLSEDGASFAADLTTSDTTVWQSVQPARTDITAKTNTVSVVARETKRATIEAYTMVDFDDVTALAGGEIVFDEEAVPNPKYVRVLVIGEDVTDTGPIYIGRLLPRARVTAIGDQSFNAGDDGLQWELTFTGYTDPVIGTAQRWFFGGPGLAAIAADAGLPTAV